MHRQHTMPHGPHAALLPEPRMVLTPFRSLKNSLRHLSAGQAREKALKAAQRTRSANLQASEQPSSSTIQAAGVVERDAAAQQGCQDAPERLSSSALLRRLTAVSMANEALDTFLQDPASRQSPSDLQGFTEASPLSCKIAIVSMDSLLGTECMVLSMHSAHITLQVAAHYSRRQLLTISR